MINTIILNFGYAEDSSLAHVVFHNDMLYFNSNEEAIESLSKDLLALFNNRYTSNNYLQECCNKNIKNKNNVFCNKCGMRLLHVFDKRKFYDYVVGLRYNSLNEFGYEEFCDNRDITWEPYVDMLSVLNTPKENILVIEQAEKVIFETLKLDINF